MSSLVGYSLRSGAKKSSRQNQSAWAGLPRPPQITRLNLSAFSCAELTYLASEDPDEAIIRIDGEDVLPRPEVHPVTQSKPNGKTSRHFTSPGLVRKLRSPLIVPSHSPRAAHASTASTASTENDSRPLRERLRSRSHDRSSPPPETVSATDVVAVDLAGGRLQNAVLFGSPNSQNEHLREVHGLYRRLKDRIAANYFRAPAAYRHTDDLAGGKYFAYGLGSISPGPAGCPRRVKKAPYRKKAPAGRGKRAAGGKSKNKTVKKAGKSHVKKKRTQKKGRNREEEFGQLPYLRATARSGEVVEIFGDYAKILGAVTRAVKELLPDLFRANQELGRGADDCAYPTPGMQNQGQNPKTAVHWFGNQVILRIIGKEIGKHSIKEGRIAMHNDDSDYPCVQVLMFLPMGGKEGFGGHVEGTDLLVFEDKTGGKSYRVDTTVEDTVVIVLMNSAIQLHAGAAEEGPEEQEDAADVPACWSMRFISYCRGPIMEFIEERRELGGGPSPFVDLPPRADDSHVPLDGESLQDGMEVAAKWGKGNNKRYYGATLWKDEESGKIDLHWHDNTHSPNWKQSVYAPECALSD